MSDQNSTNQDPELSLSNTKPATTTTTTAPATLSLSILNLDLSLTNKKRKKSFVSTFRSRNSFDLISKSSCEFIDSLSNDPNTDRVKVLPSSDSTNNITMDNFSLLNDFKNLNRNNFKFHAEENLAASSSSGAKSHSSGSFLRTFGNRLKMSGQNRTVSLCELNKLASTEIKQPNGFFTKNIHDQLVPLNLSKATHLWNEKVETHQEGQQKNSDFDNFSNLNFYKQCNVGFIC
jgi:hypothetical protein